MLLERIAEKIDASGDCWEWTGARIGGYGRMWCNGKNKLAHRFVWESLVGPIPDGMTLDHLCRNPGCVNPDHLEVVTHRVNVLRGCSPSARHARKTQCPQGHPYDEKNAYLGPSGRRYCRQCGREREARRTQLARGGA